MKKKVLSALMALALCLSLLPAAAFAAENEDVSAQSGAQESKISTRAAAAHDHCLCGATHKNSNGHMVGSSITFTPWTDELAAKQYDSDKKTAANSLPSTGNDFYYLTKDVELSTSWKPADKTVLCLNGHSITSTSYYGAITVGEGVEFTLTDCNGSNKTYRFGESYKRWQLDDSGSHEIDGGIITTSTSITSSGSGVLVQSGGVFNMYGGTIVGNRGTTVSAGGTSGGRGGGVYVKDANSRFNLYGGAITGNTANGKYATLGGGGVFVYGGAFTMYGGEITNNAATENSNNGGGVQVYTGTFNMTGGTIGGEGKGNTARNGGSGVYVRNAAFTMSGDAAIIGNSAGGSGGGVLVSDSGTFTMSGDAKIIDNQATGNQSNGGGVCMSNGRFTMSGDATITGNSCSSASTYSNGGGVFIDSNGTFNVSDNVQITGNTKNNKANNVYLGQSNNDPMAAIKIGEDGLNNAKIGVTAREPAAGLVIATGATENKNYTEIITSDDDTYEVAHDSTDATKLVLKVAPEKPHEHFLCGGDECTKVGGHEENEKTTFATKLWMDGDTLKMGDEEWKPTTTTVGSNNPSPHYVLSEGSYYLGSDIKLTESIHIKEGVKLCLNGHSIISDGTVVGRYVIIVESSSLVLTDCKGNGRITHADGKNGGGVSVYNPSSVFNMFGGIITGNNIDGGVKNNGAFNMYGGEITKNSANINGGGVYVAEYSTAFKVSGSAKITDNTVDNAANNVYLPSGKTFTLGSHFTKDTYIGVTTAEKPTDKKHVTIVSNAGTMSYDNVVKADDSENYKTQMDGADLVLAAKNGGTTPTEHEHFLCGGDSCTCPVKETKKVEFQPWESTTSLPKDTGNYYLTGNVTLENYWTPANNTVLDLNGYSITVNKDTETRILPAAGAITVNENCTFTLVDCKGGKTEYGQITHGTNTETSSKYPGSGVCVYGTFNMYGGKITDNEVKYAYRSGGGVYVNAKGIFTLYGGSITGNKSNNANGSNVSGAGGGVYTVGTFTMYGGNITGNEAYRDGGGVLAASDFTMEGGTISGNMAKGQHYKNDYIGGGGVFVVKGKTFTMKGGTISDNTAYGAGGGVYMQDYQGSFVMENGTISGNKAMENSTSYYAGKGGGVYVGSGSDCIFTMKNGSITGNSAVNGGGVYVTGRFTMSGGTIGGTEESAANTASGDGGGVYVYSSSSSYVHACVMSGNATVTGNKKIDGTANNVWLPSNDRYIIISGELTGTHPIGVTMSDYPKNGWTIPITYTNTNYNYTVTEADKDKFTSDMDGYEIKFRQYDNRLVLAEESTPKPGKVDAGVKITADNANDPAPTEVAYDDTFMLGTTLQTTGTAGRPITSDWTWTSSDPDVLSVTGNGSAATVKALKVGTATITVTYESENAKGTATATITVNKREISVKADNKDMTVGGALPAFTVTYGNFASGNTANTVLETQPVPTTTADGKTAGSFDITVEAPTLKSDYMDKYTVGTPQKGTLTVKAASNNNNSSSSGSSSEPRYTVSAPSAVSGGAVKSNVSSARRGDTVTVTATPDSGYQLASITATDAKGNTVKLTAKGDGKYTFVQPAGTVTIQATFAPVQQKTVFDDVSENSYYYEAVQWAAENGITEGIGKNLFGPGKDTTRAQVITFLWRAAGSPEVSNVQLNFTDVKQSAYYAKAVQWAAANGITNGTGNGKFSPDKVCSRAETVALMHRAAGSPAASGSSFSDVSRDAYYAGAAGWAAENGVTRGVGGNRFAPNRICTRSELVTMLYQGYAD